jgi:hypothetical protein
MPAVIVDAAGSKHVTAAGRSKHNLIEEVVGWQRSAGGKTGGRNAFPLSRDQAVIKEVKCSGFPLCLILNEVLARGEIEGGNAGTKRAAAPIKLPTSLARCASPTQT